MVAYIKSDLEFILAQIKIAEDHAAGADLAGLLPSPILPFGLRTVDGTFNNLYPGRSDFGAADTLFPRLVTAQFLNEADGDSINLGPGGVVVNTNYGATGNVADADPRIISNLIVDMSLNNPAAVAAALKYSGIEGLEANAARSDIDTDYQDFLIKASAAAAAEAFEVTKFNELQTAIGELAAATAANTTAQATLSAYGAADSQIEGAGQAIDTIDLAQDAVQALLLTMSLGSPVNTALVDSAVNAANTAAIQAGEAAAALAADVNVNPADQAAANALAANALSLHSQLVTIQSGFVLDPIVDAADITDVGTAAALAINNELDVGALSGLVNAQLVAATPGTAAFIAAGTAATFAAETIEHQTAFDAHASAVTASNLADGARNGAAATLAATLDSYGIVLDDSGTSLVIPNVATDEGLSAPFNSWFTLFGQFFDHGLDLVTKGGNGFVFVPLEADDPLVTHGPDGIAGTGDEITNPAQQFMALKRATPTLVDPDGAGPLPPAAEHTNTTTPWIDQNQTYTSHASHQVFLREYEFSVDTNNDLINDAFAVSTGRLIEGVDGGPGNWAQVKAQAALMLGITLTDYDVVNVPKLVTDQYGRFIPGANGFAQIETASGIVLGQAGGIALPPDTIRTGHAFLDDIAHAAVPFHSQFGTPILADGDSAVGLSQAGRYDNELLDAHKVTGDGRGNENIGLTTVHHIFHAEHNRLAEHTKEVAVASALETGGAEGLAFLNEWLDPANQINALPLNQAEIDALIWNGERIFQAAKFGTEMQYQHLVFEEFGRKVQPLINLFGPYNGDIDPSIVAEFAHVVYRFGHSMLTEDVARMNPNGTTSDIGLIDAFLNPVEFDAPGGVPVSAEVAAGAIIRGMTRQVGNEIDEFVTGALRNNLLGLPLDLAVFNIARARDTGAPTLNEARAQFYAGTGDAQLKPYESWVEFAANAKHELSVINFIAAYGQHSAVLAAVTLEDKRKAAVALALGDNDATPDSVFINGVERDISDRTDFLNSTGLWTAANSGLNSIDFWIGGLAEKVQPFGGLLGSTFNFVFETQMENLQDSDRFYYLRRLAGTHFLTELEGNSFAQMAINNTNLGEDGMHLPGDIFSVPTWILELDQSKQITGIDDGISDGVDRGDPTGGNIFLPLVIRNNPATGGPDTNYLRYTGPDHVVLGGTANDDILISSIGDDTVWGDGGHDRIEGGAGVDQLLGGDGNDIITDINGDDLIQGQGGDDVVNSGDGLDLIILGDGNDFSVGGKDINETFGGEGDDYIIAGDDADVVFGDGGNDWIEGGLGQDLLQGDFGNPFQDSKTVGNDIIIGGAGDDDYDSESGDDIMLADDGIERNEGMLGFDWVTYKNDTQAADADMFFTGLLPPDQDAIRDRFDLVEGLSGWDFNDTLRGDNADSVLLSNIDPTSGLNHAINNQGQIDLINGLQGLLGTGVTSFSGGNIILGGGGSDTIEGRGGDDILDGDAKLNVRISISANGDGTGGEVGSADGMTTPISSLNPALNGKSLVELMFNKTLTPGQLSIVREILSTNNPGDVDIAVYSDLMNNYLVSAPDGDGFITVTHLTRDAAGVVVPGVFGADGIDRVRNIELLQFSDGVNNLAGIANQAAAGTLQIVDPTPGIIQVGDTLSVTKGSITDGDGVPDISTFNLVWQVEQTLGLGDWIDLEDPVTEALITGLTFTPTADLDGLRLRVRGTFVDGHNFPEAVVSAPTPPLGASGPFAPSVVPITLTPPVNESDNPAPITITRAQLLSGTDDFDTPFANLQILNLQAGSGTLTMTIPGLEWSFTPPANDGSQVLFTFLVSDGLTAVPNTATLDLINDNDAPVSTLAVDNLTPTNNDTLSLVGTIFDADGTANSPLSIQWQSSADGLAWDNIAGANELTFRPRGAEVGLQLRVVIDYVDDEGTPEQVLTQPTAVVGDNFVGTNAANAITGTEGRDVINARRGNDTILGLGGDDVITGAAGADTAIFTSAVSTATFALSGAALQVTTPTDGTDTLTTIETLRFDGVNFTLRQGTNANNALTGAAASDILLGFGGNDTLNGAGGADVMIGGIGNDTYRVDNAADVVRELAGEGTADAVQTSLLTYTLAENVENLAITAGTTGNRVWTGNDLNNVITSNGGTDTLDGGAGNDTLNGAGGSDVLIGGAGDDTLIVSTGNDTIRIVGTNLFGADVVTGFDANPTAGQDRIELNGLGIDGTNFGTRVDLDVTDLGGDENDFTLVTILADGGIDILGTLRLNGVNGIGANTITSADFLFS